MEKHDRDNPSDPGEMDVDRLLHDLKVHQVELEMQNEDLRNSQEELSRAREQYRNLFDFAPVPYFILDGTGTITAFNHAAVSLLGIENRHYVKKPFLVYVSEEHHRRYFEHLRLVFESDARRQIEIKLHRPDGRNVWVLMESRRVNDDTESPASEAARCLSAVLDITDRKAMEDELVQARETALAGNRAKSEFLSSMSHELRTPLNAILGFAQLLHAEQDLTESQGTYAQEILDAGNHLRSLVDEILDLSRIERGKIELTLEAVDCGEVVDEAREEIRPIAKDKNLRLEPEEPLPSGIVATADRKRLKQVLLNLLSNAVKYNRDDGTITVALERAEESVKIHVHDTGVGISEEKQASLFTSFNRLGRETGNVAGTGIGLALSKQLTTLMEGSVGCTSTPEVGSSFWITLPAHGDPGESDTTT